MIGVDPGHRGAYVVLADDGRTALSWGRCSGPIPPVLDVRPGDVLALEAQHSRADRPGSLVLSEWCGRLLATLPAGVVVLRPHPATWRVVLEAPRLRRREDLKRRALEVVRAHGRGLPDRLSHDLAEAWCLARWAWLWDRAGRPAGPGVPPAALESP